MREEGDHAAVAPLGLPLVVAATAEDARRIAAGISMTPQQVAGFRDRAMKRVQTPDPTTGRLQFRTPAEQNAEVERRNALIEEARADLQDQAEQLALSAKYKSEFLANMSHELRSPLNSLLLPDPRDPGNASAGSRIPTMDALRVIFSRRWIAALA